MYLHQLSPEETPSGLLTVNCPRLYPEMLHVEGHSWEDGLATREQLQFSYKCIAWHFLVYDRHKSDEFASFLEKKNAKKAQGVKVHSTFDIFGKKLNARKKQRYDKDEKEAMAKRGRRLWECSHMKIKFLRSLFNSFIWDKQTAEKKITMSVSALLCFNMQAKIGIALHNV